jgi:NAD(P)-dependent dehydrogenase (short-subunit alcohol dehydrogenase family)
MLDFKGDLSMSRIAMITGATRNLGYALAQGLAQRMNKNDIVYLTGRDPERVKESTRLAAGDGAEVRGEVLDVSSGRAIERFAAKMREKHEGIDIVISNHYARVLPTDDQAKVVDYYVTANNFGTTNILRSFVPMLRDGGRLLVIASRLGTLRTLAPVLHSRFEDLNSLDEVDASVTAWRDAVREGRAGGEAWPGWINIPSKIGQVAAVRVLAKQRRAEDAKRDIMICAISPGLIDTGASRPYFADMSRAKTPEAAAGPLLDFVLQPKADPKYYGELVHLGTDKGVPGSRAGFGKIVPWKA